MSYAKLPAATKFTMETELRHSLVTLHSASFGWATICCHGNRELAEDVLQSVYVSVLDDRARFAGRSTFRTWLFAVIRNAARHQLRKRWWSRVVRLEFESEPANPTACARSIAAEEEEFAIVRAALDRLPQRQREVVHLVFYEDLTVDEAAEVMSVSAGTARQHYARAKKALTSTLNPLRKQRDEPIAS